MSSLEDFTPDKKLLIKGDLNQPHLIGINVVNPQTGNSYNNIAKIVLTLIPYSDIVADITYHPAREAWQVDIGLDKYKHDLKTMQASDIRFDLPDQETAE